MRLAYLAAFFVLKSFPDLRNRSDTERAIYRVGYQTFCLKLISHESREFKTPYTFSQLFKMILSKFRI